MYEIGKKKRINKNTFYKKTLIALNFIILDKEPEAKRKPKYFSWSRRANMRINK